MKALRFFYVSLLLIFLSAPLWLLLIHFTPTWDFPLSELLNSLFITASQSFWSSLLSMILGFLGALALLYYYNSKKINWLKSLYLIPNFTPVLFIILGLLNFLDYFIDFKFGHNAIVLFHTVINTGLVSLLLVELLYYRVGAMAELAWVEGATFIYFYTKALSFIKTELLLIAFTVFSFCFMSFSVPLIVGQGATTLEVLIYEKIRLQSELGQATALAVVQILFFLVIAVLIKKNINSSKAPKNINWSYYSVKYFIFIPLAISLSFIIGLVPGFIKGGLSFINEPQLLLNLMPSVMYSLLLSLLTAFFIFIGLSFIAYLNPCDRLRSLLIGYVAPSSVVTGFVFLLYGDNFNRLQVFIKLALALTLIFLPFLYRFRLDAALLALQSQIRTARVCGAQPFKIFCTITAPQLIKPLCFLAGLAGLWTSGEYALSTILLDQDLTLALQIKTLLTHYRYDEATLMVGVLLLCGIGVWLLCQGVGIVCRQKFNKILR